MESLRASRNTASKVDKNGKPKVVVVVVGGGGGPCVKTEQERGNFPGEMGRGVGGEGGEIWGAPDS